ncbi:ABC transporter permease [Sediminivirga luteola]|nr:ABC transporter permease [Sediminivirga luteola]
MMADLATAPKNASRLVPLPGRRPRTVTGRNLQVGVALVIIAVVVLSSVFAPLVAPHDPLLSDPASKYLPPGSPGHLLGTDDQGRDLLSRIIWGGRTSLLIAVVAVAFSTVVGSALAIVAGFAGPLLSGLIMRTVDVMFAFPVIIVAVALAALFAPGPSVVILAIAFAVIPYVSRVVFAEVKQQKGQDYVEAAVSLGAGHASILFREVLPNVTTQIIVYATSLVGGMVVFASSLSAVGIGVQPPTADWGQMIATGARVVISGNLYVALFPGLMVLIVALAFNWLGDGLRDVLDVRQRSGAPSRRKTGDAGADGRDTPVGAAGPDGHADASGPAEEVPR